MLGVGAANRKTERRRNVIRHRSVGLREMLDDIDGKHSDVLRRIGIDEEIELAGAFPVQHVVAEMSPGGGCGILTMSNSRLTSGVRNGWLW